MKRRDFLKTVGGVVAAAVVAPKINPASAAPSAPAVFASKAWQGIVTSDFPMLRSPIEDLAGPPLTVRALELTRSKIWELKAMQPMRTVIVGDGSGRIGYVL